MEDMVQEGRVLLHKYELRELIGWGGTGRVYKAYDRHLNQTVAVKQIVRGEQEGIKAESLWNEVEVLKRMEHRALPKICDYFQEGEHDYLVLEYIQGVTLEQYIMENGPMEQQQAISLMKELVSVFLYLHSFRPPIIYRDLKPANIMLRGDGHIKLIDFGTAFVYSYGKTEQVIQAGTPGFSGPELLTGRMEGRGCREGSDVYSLGAVFHYILTGAKPMSLSFVRRPVREYNSAISDGIERIILNCMQENMQKRYHSVQQLQQDLEEYKRLERNKILKGQIVRTVYLLLLAAGIFLVLAEARNGIALPLLEQEGKWEWNREYQIPVTLLRGLVLLLAGSCCKIIYRIKNRKNRYIQKQEKNICLTEKKTIGLWGSILLMGWILTAILCGGEVVYAEEESIGQLPVIVRDSTGCKLLIQEDAVYEPARDIILEVPLSGFPEGEEVIMQVIVSDKERQYESRKFLIMVGESENWLTDVNGSDILKLPHS